MVKAISYLLFTPVPIPSVEVVMRNLLQHLFYSHLECGLHWLDLLLHWDSLKIRIIDQWCVQIQTNQLSPHHWFVLPWILSLFRPIGLAESCAFSSVYDKNHELIVIRKHLAILPFISDIYWPVHVRKMW